MAISWTTPQARSGFGIMARMEDRSDEDLAAEVSRRLAQAKELLASQMKAAGLEPSEGWTILEDLRSRPNCTVYIFRPIHRRLPAPELETSVGIDFEGRPVEPDEI